MFLWDKSSRIVLGVLITSTAHKYYFTEIEKQSELAPGTVASILCRLTDANVVIREEERFQYDSPFRAERVYYSINPDVISYLRLD